MAKQKTQKNAEQTAASIPAEPVKIEKATEDQAPAGDATPAPTQGNEGQAVAAEGGNPSAGHDPEIHEQTDVGGTLTVTGPAKGRWRAGLPFTPEAVTLNVSDLTDDQVVAITNDPELAVLHTAPQG